MKKLLFFLFAAVTFLLAGCFETTQEVTLNGDGSGTVTNTNDMSTLVGLLKQMGGGKDMEKSAGEALDTTISMEKLADSIGSLTPAEKEMAKKGTVTINMNIDSGKLITSIKFPFAKAEEITLYNQLASRIMMETLKSRMGDSSMAGLGGNGGMPRLTSLDDYYTESFSKGLLVKTLNKEKFATAENDEFLKAMKEAGENGMPMTANYIINLPRPAKKAEGTNIKLSADKKKITVTSSIEDFFDDPTKMEFRIEY